MILLRILLLDKVLSAALSSSVMNLSNMFLQVTKSDIYRDWLAEIQHSV